jgi:hypothetical protein
MYILTVLHVPGRRLMRSGSCSATSKSCLSHSSTIGDGDGEFLSVGPLTKLPNEVGVPSFVGGVHAFGQILDENASLVDAEADVELLEVETMSLLKP